MPKCYRFVLTGGPCGGKTTALPVLRSYFEKQGYAVQLFQEDATQLVQSGIFPAADHGFSFQTAVLRQQLERNQMPTKVERDTICFFDRGMLDGKAFLNDDALWQRMLREQKTTENDLLCSYDGVFHLVTAAKGAARSYTLSNNAVRRESPKEAVEIDNRMIDAWDNHPRFFLIENKGDFEKKLSDLIAAVETAIEQIDMLRQTVMICQIDAKSCMVHDGSVGDRKGLYQFGLLQYLAVGDYSGKLTVGELKYHGDFGIGTFDCTDGELILLDGVVYQACSDGMIRIPDHTMTVPFANASEFTSAASGHICRADSIAELSDALQLQLEDYGRDRIILVKLTGYFPKIRVRSEYRQTPPFRPLHIMMAQDQVEFSYTDVTGTLIGLYFPTALDGLNVPGWHFHFLSAEKDKGGHVLEGAVRDAVYQLDVKDRIEVQIPAYETDLDRNLDAGRIIKQIETGT